MIPKYPRDIYSISPWLPMVDATTSQLGSVLGGLRVRCPPEPWLQLVEISETLQMGCTATTFEHTGAAYLMFFLPGVKIPCHV